MEFSVKRSDLLDELELTQGVVERKTTIPILSNLLVEAKGSRLTITATDLELSIRTSCDAKVKKEANRFIQRWADEKIAVENGRWGPFIRFGKKMLKIPKKDDDTKYTAEEAAQFSLDDVKKFIEVEMPGAFTKKEKKAPAKKAAKKAATKKAAPKKKKG